LLEEEQVNYFSGSSNSGDTSVKLVGIEKGTSGTASAGGVVDGYSYFGNEPNPDHEDDSPLSRQSEWITQFAKQRSTGRRGRSTPSRMRLKLKCMCCWVNFLPNTMLFCSIL
jgi:hypothetical protein